MTIRRMPVATIGARPANVQSDIAPQALDRWNPQIRAAGTDNNVISIMDVIGADFMGTGVTANRVTGALRAIGNKPVVVEINSPGGDFFEGLAIYNALREHPKDVTVKVLGVAASAAAVVAMAGDTIMVPRAGFIMIHNVWVLAIGNKDDLRAAADFLEPFDAVTADIFTARTGLSDKKIAKMLDDETWIGGSEAVELGFADSLLPSDEIETAKNELIGGPAGAARRIDAAMAKGERLPRSERRKLLKELTGTPCAAEGEGTPRAADSNAKLRMALASLELATA